MGAITTLKQNNKPWTLTWKASGRYPIVADRIFATLADAQAYVDDTSATASATGGLVLSVISDTVAKNNGVYYVKSVANTDSKYGALLDKGTLVKVGGAETEVAATYSAAVTLSNTLVVGQLIKVSGEETVDDQTYKAGFYIVNAPGSISALDTSTGASDEIGALTNRVTTLEGNRVLNTDFATYKTEVSNGLAAKADATALTSHTTDTTIHVTAEDKAKWNNAEANANAKLAEELAKLPSQYDGKGAAATALSDAKAYVDGIVNDSTAEDGSTVKGLKSQITDLGSDFSTHKTNSTIHITTDEREAWNKAKSDIDAFLNTTDLGDDVIDTLKEIQNYITSDGAAAKEMLDSIDGLKTAVGAPKSDDSEATGLYKIIADNEKVTATALTDLDGRVDALEAYKTTNDTDIADLKAASHTHDNKSVLDGISDVKVAAWDAAESNAKTYTDELFASVTFIGKDDIDSIFA